MTIEGEVEGKGRPERRKTSGADNIRMWTEVGINMSRENVHKGQQFLRDNG